MDGLDEYPNNSGIPTSPEIWKMVLFNEPLYKLWTCSQIMNNSYGL